jgi:hypothetical protein
MIEAARRSMPEKEIQRLKTIGEEMYKDIDFEKVQENNIPPEIKESLLYVDSLIKSGLHPSMLNENEKFLLIEGFGPKWYENYGYVKEDLNEIVTVKMKD